MNIIAVVSAKGGVGKTTVTANLSTALVETGNAVLAIDLDPQNALRMHFGMPHQDYSGIAQEVLAGRPWHEAVFRNAFGVNFLPYGTVSEEERTLFENFLAQDEDWLARCLSELDLPDNAFVTIDTPPGPSIYLTQALRAANFALMVAIPDAASYITLPAMENLIRHYCYHRPGFRGAAFVLNQVDTALGLERDIQSVVRAQLGNNVAPISIHRDASVSEALAYEQSVLTYARHSQASHDILSLTTWLTDTIAAHPGTHPA